MTRDHDEPVITHEGRTLFTAGELQCKGTGILRLAPFFAEELLSLRLAMDEPMEVTSCCRAASHNEAVGGHPRSLHVADKPYHDTGGCAAIDIRTTDAGYRGKLIRLALANNWSVGVHPEFTHLDRRSDHTGRPQALFLY